MGAIVGSLLKSAAEGKFGPKVKAAYWWLAGNKTHIGAWLTFAGLVLEAGDKAGICSMFGLDCGGWAVIVAKTVSIGTGLGFVAIGQVDGALRMDPPKG